MISSQERVFFPLSSYLCIYINLKRFFCLFIPLNMLYIDRNTNHCVREKIANICWCCIYYFLVSING